jgi:bile acid:Na+ symporter, BASS family
VSLTLYYPGYFLQVIGILCHYTIMPVLGFTLASLFSLPKEIAAGIILVGCCPSGLASNVMSFLARANLALSISVTTVSTLNWWHRKVLV